MAVKNIDFDNNVKFGYFVDHVLTQLDKYDSKRYNSGISIFLKKHTRNVLNSSYYIRDYISYNFSNMYEFEVFCDKYVIELNLDPLYDISKDVGSLCNDCICGFDILDRLKSNNIITDKVEVSMGLVIHIVMKNIKNIVDEIDFIYLLENLKDHLCKDNLYKIKNDYTNRSVKDIEIIDKFKF